jgi:putative SOS response-associated peptidase YedK
MFMSSSGCRKTLPSLLLESLSYFELSNGSHETDNLSAAACFSRLRIMPACFAKHLRKTGKSSFESLHGACYHAGMCGKASVEIRWKDVYAWASSLTPPGSLPPDPEARVNVSPSRLRRKNEPESMVWETLPVIRADGEKDWPEEAIWPYLPYWSHGQLPHLKSGKLLSTANARLRHESKPFAPTFMHAWERDQRVLVIVSWFYEFDSRVHPQVPYAVFPLNQGFWVMAGLCSRYRTGESAQTSVAIITVEPNEVLKSVGHHRSPALLRNPEEAQCWLRGNREDALSLLKPYPDEQMGVEPVPMGIKIPGNQNISLPDALAQSRSEQS